MPPSTRPPARAEKCAACERLGATRAINYRTEDFVEVVRAATGGAGVDVVLDMVGGDYVSRNLEVLAVEGRLVQIAFLRGQRVEVNLAPLMQKRLTFTGRRCGRARPSRRAPSRGRSSSTSGRVSNAASCAL